MPELPEVESVRRGLARWVTGARVEGVRVLDERILGTTSQRDIPAGAGRVLAAEVDGAGLLAPERRGKFLWVPLSDGQRALALHLGMSGQLRIHTPDEPLHRHTRAVFELAPPEPPGQGPAAEERVELRFVDQRIFGHVGIEPLVYGRAHWGSAERRPAGASAAEIAPDPFEEGFDVAATARVMGLRRSPVKAVLLDQGVVSGIGNIYADEALHAAGVHPAALAARLRPARLRAVLEAARSVMAAALDAGGTSFDALYVHVNGESGRYALNVYGREGHPCNRCGTPIVREKFRNRSSHFCPRCQRKR